MKIYIKNFNPSDLNISHLEKYIQKKDMLSEIYTSNGIYRIEENKIYRLKPIDFPVEEIKYKNTHILLDSSFFEKEQVHQLPINHTHLQIQYHVYRISKLKVIVEFEQEKVSNMYMCMNVQNKNEHSNEKGKIDKDFIYSELNALLGVVKNYS